MSKIHQLCKKECFICFDDEISSLMVFHKTRRQTHSLCYSCGHNYVSQAVKKYLNLLRNNIRQNPVILCSGNIHCSTRNKCGKNIDIRKININLNSELSSYINIISLCLENENIYLCQTHDCFNLIVSPDLSDSKITCHKCLKSWCKKCQVNPFHEGLTCLEYKKTQDDNINEQFIQELVKKGDIKFCPGCNSHTEKEKTSEGKYTGCNKITCEICGVKWCWLCGEKNIDYDHYNEANKTYCSNKLWQNVDIS